MAQLSKTLTKIVLIICVLVFIVRLIKSGSFTPSNFIDTTLMAVALAVAAIFGSWVTMIIVCPSR